MLLRVGVAQINNRKSTKNPSFEKGFHLLPTTSTSSLLHTALEQKKETMYHILTADFFNFLKLYEIVAIYCIHMYKSKIENMFCYRFNNFCHTLSFIIRGFSSTVISLIVECWSLVVWSLTCYMLCYVTYITRVSVCQRVLILKKAWGLKHHLIKLNWMWSQNVWIFVSMISDNHLYICVKLLILPAFHWLQCSFSGFIICTLTPAN